MKREAGKSLSKKLVVSRSSRAVKRSVSSGLSMQKKRRNRDDLPLAARLAVFVSALATIAALMFHAQILSFFSDVIIGHGNATAGIWDSSSSRDFTCTGNAQQYVAPYTGDYRLDTWGAQGGGGGYNSYESVLASGGMGGYASGTVHLTQGVVLYIYVGCQGQTPLPTPRLTMDVSSVGGWNGGGSATQYGNGAGGGGTDIRIGADNLYNRVIVAGGGGGGGNSQSATVTSNGGAGGGVNGQTMPTSTQFSGRTPGGGGTQSAPGTSNSSTVAAAFGQGAGGSGDNLRGGGGGGWYGGGMGTNSTGGGGGSGYVLTSTSHKPSGYALGNQYYLSNTVLKDGTESMLNPAGGNMTGRTGNGFARITPMRIPPEITLVGDDPLVIAVGTVFADPGATATDATDGDLTSSVVATGSVNTYAVGNYVVTYSVTNTANLSASTTRTVKVVAGGQGFSCTQAAQTFVATKAGTYRLETWGAQGGSPGTANIGGLGGYSAGTITLAANDTLYLYPGCQGQVTTGTYAPGGWNGGGQGGKYSGLPTGGGGGASDIRTVAGSLYARVIVAGGGGGGGCNYCGAQDKGGVGGGTSGFNGMTGSQYYGYGGTQTAGGTTGADSRRDAVNGPGTFGQGGSMLAGSENGNTTGGGGGGWYGGGAAVWEGGGGGSGYVYNASTAASYPVGGLLNSNSYLANSYTLGGSQSMATHTGTNTMVGNTGDGYIKITPLVVRAAPTITLVGSNSLTIDQGSAFVDPGATATDEVDGDLTASIVTTGNVDTSTAGTYQITYTVTNSFGLTATVTRTVKVERQSTVVNFPCTGAMQTWTAPITAEYTFEAWGAQGGNGMLAAYTGDYVGGKGGYSTGKVSLTAGTTLYIYSGCAGRDYTDTGTAKSFNGGGISSHSTTATNKSGDGGGASDIRIGTDSLYARAIVAGGGGGAGYYNFGSGTPTANASGGVGGGASGLPGNYNQNAAGVAGTQTGGGAFGVGGSSASSAGRGGAGGGGGWYGGTASNIGNSVHTSGGGGGSGYVYTSSTVSSYPSGSLLNSSYYLTDAQTIAGDLSMPAPGGGNETGHAGNGQVRISYTLPAIEEFNYTGAVRTWTVPITGNYKLETWGAAGGYGGNGGAGGYSSGQVGLTAGQTLYIYVGQAGGMGQTTGMFGGGGQIGSYTSTGQGGGASDIRIGADSLYARVIVAGGGGGSYSTSTLGGAGGGSSGIAGGTGTNGGGGGTQTAGGTGRGAGLWGAGAGATGFSDGSGGGGWYGGAMGYNTASQAGGGGSGWIYTASTYSTWAAAVSTTMSNQWLLTSAHYLTNASTVAGNVANGMPTFNGSGTMTGNTGNGYVRITRL